MTSTPTEAPNVTREPVATLHVVVLGGVDPFASLPTGLAEIEVEWCDSVEEAVRRRPDVVHLFGQHGVDLEALRRQLPAASIVLDLSQLDAPQLGRLEARRSQAADRILVSSDRDLQELARSRRTLAPLLAAARPPLDLDWYAPLAAIGSVQARDRELKRFRRVHRIVDSMILFVGPYVPGGGLDLMLDAVFELREQSKGLRLAAIPYGPIDHSFLDSCERRALALGHHGIVEWNAVREELPLWFGFATVVCSNPADGAAALPARLAAAAGRPFVGTRGGTAGAVVADGETGTVVPPRDPRALQAALEALVLDTERADALGTEARARAEACDGAAAAGEWAAQAWMAGRVDRG